MKRFLGYAIIAMVFYVLGKYISDSYVCGWLFSSVSTMVMQIWDNFRGEKTKTEEKERTKLNNVD